MASPEKDEKFGTAEGRMEEDKTIQEKPEEEEAVQKMDAPKEEEEPVQKMDAPKEEEEPVQKMDAPKEEEPVQKMDAPKEEEEPVQKMDAPKEEEEPVQKMDAPEEEEEPVQKMDAPKEEEEAVQKKGAEEEEPVQAKAASNGPAAAPISSRLKDSKGKGRPLSGKTRQEMESGIGADFGGVRLHTDDEAVGLNEALRAQAFTNGRDVYFNKGKYNPETSEGKRLLAHELTHVVQQGEAGVSGKTSANNIQRWINWDKNGDSEYKKNREGLLKELKAEFYYIDAEKIEAQITLVEQKNTKWSPYQAYQGIKNYLKANFKMPPSEVGLQGTNISAEEARWYFISDFKTMIEAVVDSKYVFKFFSTPDNEHAEDNMMKLLNQFIEEKGWHEDFSESHTLRITINNSPCKRCAPRIYDWHYRDIFVDFEIYFANLYQKDNGFTEATTKLRSGGVAMSLMQVENDLIKLIGREKFMKEEIEKRAMKDKSEGMHWHNWNEKMKGDK
ncbi:MAG: DUF4157 domain-containing protein [Saprospiraceae bacterium]|nr:DUF4157 domain-containing protein [Saprospiraceae bacterium]